MDYARIAAHVFNVPLLATPDAAGAVADYLVARMAGVEAAMGRTVVTAEETEDPYTLDADGMATIAVHGELVNRGSWMDAYSGLTSYKALGAALDAAARDPRVRGIALDIDSPGGEAAGAMEAAAHVRAVSQKKPVVAYIDSLAASAAYAVASGASEIVATPSATLGSIGVVWLHLDRSAAMKDRGVKPTLLHAGAYKVDGNSMQPLPDDARARIQSKIDEVYGLFLATVGAHRPKLGSEGARATEAGVFMGTRAVETGVADRIGDWSTVKSILPRKPLWSLKMSNDPVYTQEAHDSALAAARREAAAATDAAVTQATAAERARIAAILDAPAAAGREAQARHFAFRTAMTPADAVAALEVAPVAAAPEASPLDRAMTTQDSPRLGASGGPAAPPPRGIDTAAVYAARAAVQRGR